MIKDQHKEFPPDQLVQPGLTMRRSDSNHFPHTYGSETKVYAYLTGAILSRKVALFLVDLQTFWFQKGRDYARFLPFSSDVFQYRKWNRTELHERSKMSFARKMLYSLELQSVLPG